MKHLHSTEYDHRLIGEIHGSEDGPIIIALAGIHGNEPTGIDAIEHVLEKLYPVKDRFKGSLIGLKGNLQALETHQRYVEEDMNRIWHTSILDKIRRTPIEDLITLERKEVKELLNILDPLILDETLNRQIVFADFHTFSADTGLFAITPRKEENIKLLGQLKVPLIFGIENALYGTALKYFQMIGHIGFGFEAGKHFSEEAELNASAGLLCMLVGAGCIPASLIKDYPSYHDYLGRQTAPLPHKVEFQYKHIIEPGDAFRMKPGYRNFDRVKKGDWLAEDRHGKIMAQKDGFILMPLYQEQGEDGFYIVTECD